MLNEIQLVKYTLATGWEFVKSYGVGKITAQIEDDARKRSGGELWGYLLMLNPGSSALFETVYFHDGVKLMQPPIIKEQTLPEPTLAQKFLAGISEDVIKELLVSGQDLRGILRIMIQEFGADDRHKLWPADFFESEVIELAGGAESFKAEYINLSDPSENEDLDGEEDDDTGHNGYSPEAWEQDKGDD